MPYYADCYVLVRSRSPSLVRRLLARFLPGGAEECATDYSVPQCSDRPQREFADADALAAYLETHPDEPHSIYWRSLGKSNFTQANVHYTNDGSMVMGVACPAGTVEDQLLARLKEEFDSEYGYIAYEAPPPESGAEFIAIAKANSEPNQAADG